MTVEAPATRGGSGRLRGMEGVRALAALSVVVYHVWLYGGPAATSVPLPSTLSGAMPHLALGVTVFFTLSGFLLYRPFAVAILADGPRPSIREYLRNRALRILPAYWLILAIVALVLGAAIRPNQAPGLTIGSLTDDPRDLLLAFGFLQSYHPTTLYLGIGPAWSLSVEVAFYVALPALVMLAVALLRRWPRPGIVVLLPPLALLAIGLAGKVATATVVSPEPVGGGDVSWRDVASLTFLGQADLFAPGMLLAVASAVAQSKAGGWTLGRGLQWSLLAMALAIVWLALPLGGSDGLGPYLYQTLMAGAAGVLLAIVVLAGRRGPGAAVVRLLESPILFAVGLVSYSLFLWHEPLIHLLGRVSLIATDAPGLVRNLVVVLSIALLLAAATYLFIERPALRLKRRRFVALDLPSGETRVEGSAVEAPGPTAIGRRD